MTILAAVACALPSWAAKKEAGDEEDGQTPQPEGYVEYVEVKDSSLPTSNTIATKLNIPLQLTPANVGTVGQPLIYEQDATVLGDTLKNISGLNVQNGSGVHDYFAIRGFDSVSSGLVMIDGASEPEVSYYQTYNVRGVEVYKGPAGHLYGKNPLSGAVNVVRKQPTEGSFAVFGGSFGSFATREGTLDWNQSTGSDNLSFRLNGLWQESDHYRDGMDSRHAAVNPSLTWRGDDSTLNFNFEFVDAEHNPDNGLPLVGGAIPDVSRKRSYQDPGDFSDQSLNRFQIDYEKKLNDRVTLRNKTYYRDLDWRSDGTLLQGTVQANPMTPWLAPGQVQVVRDLAVLDDRQRFAGNQLEAILSLETGSVEHRLLFGLELAHESDEYTFDIRSQPDVLLSDPSMPTAFDLGTPFPLSSVGDVTNTIVAPYVIDRIRVSQIVDVLVGVRYDYIDVDGDAKSLLSPSPTPASVSREDSEVSPMIGLVVAPDPGLSFYANVAASYAPPSTRIVDDTDPSSREPERGKQIEAGIKKRFADGKVQTTFAAYQLERDRIALTDPTNGFTQQSGDQRSRGIEVELAAEPLPGLRTFFSYAYNDAELTEFAPCVPDGGGGCTVMDYRGNTPIMAPENLANLWVSRSFGNGLGVSGGARFVDDQFVGEDNSFAIDSSLVVDGALFYDMDAWRFKLNLKNLTDEEYEMRGIAGAASVVPADPFTAYLGVEFRR